MKKATYKDIPTYYNYSKYINEKYEKGYLYYISKRLTEEEKKELLQKYNNISFYTAKSSYAPEANVNCIFIKK